MNPVVIIDDDNTQVVEIPTSAPTIIIDGTGTVVEVVSSGSNVVVEAGNVDPTVEVHTQTKGDKGDKGNQGTKGSRGDRGVPGPEGIRGRDGPDGPRGLRGPAGTGGGQGNTGPSGPPGAIDSELLLELIQPMLNEASLIPIAKIREDITAMPGKVVGDIIGDLAGTDVTESNWAAGDDDSHYVGTVSVASMITDADYKSVKTATSLIARVGGSVGAIRKEQMVMAEANRASAQETTTLLAQVGDNIAVLQTQQTTTSTLAYSTATSLTELSALTEESLATFTSQIAVMSDDLEATSSSLTTYIAENNGNIATISSAVEANADATSALATTVDGLSVSVGTISGDITELFELVSTGGEISSTWQLKTQVTSGDRVVTTGVALGASIGSDDSYKSEIIFMADTIAFITANDGELHQPFIFDVVNDTAFLNSVFIKSATINSAKFTDWLESDALGPGGTPVLRLNFRTGNIELNSGVTGEGRMTLTNQVLKVYDAAGTLRVKLGKLSA